MLADQIGNRMSARYEEAALAGEPSVLHIHGGMAAALQPELILLLGAS
jgi:hypothetical protein